MSAPLPMATIQHSAIPDGQRHEPKGISTATSGQVYVADGSGSGTWGKVNQVDNFDYSNASKNLFGWNDIADALYTSGSPRAVSSGAKTLVTNNAASAQTNTSRLGAIWSTANNEFNINDLNAFYILRVNFKATAAAAAGTPYTALMELEGGSPAVTIAAYNGFVKGGGYVNKFSISLPFYMGSYINNVPVKLYITPDTNINMYDIGFLIQRTYKES